MPAIDLPAGLVLRAQREGFSRTPLPLIVTQTDSGRPKQRPREASEIYQVAAAFRFTRTHYNGVFLPWWRVDLEAGSAWFNWTDPISMEPCEAQFQGQDAPPASVRPNGRIQISASLLMVI